MSREADREHLPSRGQRAGAVLGAVVVGITMWTLLSGIIRALSILIFTSLGHSDWISGDAPAVLDVVGFVTVLAILAVAIQVGRATRRAALQHPTPGAQSGSRATPVIPPPPPEPVPARALVYGVLLGSLVPALLGGATWWVTGVPGTALIAVAVCYVAGLVFLIVKAAAQLLRDETNED